MSSPLGIPYTSLAAAADIETSINPIVDAIDDLIVPASMWKPLDKIRAGWVPASTLSYAAYGLAAPWVRNLDPALLAVPGKTVNYRLLVHIIVGNPAPAANFTFDICPVTGVTNAAVPTAGTSIAQAVFNSPSANGLYYGVTAAFTATVGFYMLKATASAAPAAGSEVDAHIELQYRHI